MAAPDKIDISTAVFCDDIRREDNGKELLIGVYSGDIVFPHFPGRVNLCIWLPWIGKTKPEETTKFKLRLLDSDKEILGSEFEISTQEESSCGSLAIGGIVAHFHNETTLNVHVKRNSERWKTLKSIRVRSRQTNMQK